MPLSIGIRLASYEIIALLGKGGMGEVYRARDTKLNREVAIKILPDEFSSDAVRVARFQREAEVLASLNHPHIGTIYDLVNSGETRFLVLELVEGETLADRISHGRIPLIEALRIANQIAAALEAAHEKGIIHRDLKPANIKLTSDGQVKVLDFGLAKVRQMDGAGPSPSNSPTMMSATAAGMILGTAAYMSPEQANGKPAGRTADVWAFGCVLYEMLSARCAFEGETVQEILAGVLKADPDWHLLPAEAPESLRRLLRHCLQKDLKRRFRDIRDVRLEIDDVQSGPRQEGRPTAGFHRSVLPWVVAAGTFLIAAVIGWSVAWRSTRPVDHPLLRLSVDLGPDAVVGDRITAAISPDGARLAFAVRGPGGKQQLATRLLDQFQATLLSGTEDAIDPFFSPDSQWIGFFDERNKRMKKISVRGGAVVTLCEAPDGRGASWGEDGTIIATLNSQPATGLSKIPDGGGSPQEVTHPAATGEATHRWPQILPGGQAVLFTGNKTASNYEDSSIEILSLKTGQVKVVQPEGYFGRYLPGYLVYLNHGKLFGVGGGSSACPVAGFL